MRHRVFLTFTEQKVLSVRKNAYPLPWGQYGIWLTIEIPDCVFKKPSSPCATVVVPDTAVHTAKRADVSVTVDPLSGLEER